MQSSIFLSLYGCSLWLISHKSLSDLQVVFNKILRRVWHLPSMSHTGIVHCVSRIESIQNVVLKRSSSFYKRAMSSSSSLVRYIFYDSSALLYTVTGLNRECGYLYTKTYSDTDIYFSDASVSGQLSAHIVSPQCNSGNERRTNLLRLLRFVRQLIYEFNLFATAYLSLLRRNNFEHHSYCTFSCYKLSASTTLLPVVARGLNVQFNALYHTFIDSITYAQ